MAVQLVERLVQNRTILELTGDLTYANREEFKTAVDILRQKGCRYLILDLTGVRFIDSSGLGQLAFVSRNFRLTQGRVSLLRPQRYVREIMGLANITQLMPIYDSEQGALARHSHAA